MIYKNRENEATGSMAYCCIEQVTRVADSRVFERKVIVGIVCKERNKKV